MFPLLPVYVFWVIKKGDPSYLLISYLKPYQLSTNQFGIKTINQTISFYSFNTMYTLFTLHTFVDHILGLDYQCDNIINMIIKLQTKKTQLFYFLGLHYCSRYYYFVDDDDITTK